MDIIMAWGGTGGFSCRPSPGRLSTLNSGGINLPFSELVNLEPLALKTIDFDVVIQAELDNRLKPDFKCRFSCGEVC